MNQTTATEILTLEEAANYLRLPCLWSGVCWFLRLRRKNHKPHANRVAREQGSLALPVGDTH
jgi:hypothetical protein